MRTLSARRRLVLAAIGTLASFALLHAQLSAALVTRGDDMLYRANVAAALVFYRRALLLDSNSAVAADRYAFVSMIGHRPRQIVMGIAVASHFLRRHPEDAMLLMDRALCEHLLRRDRAAEKDFTEAGRLRRDPRAFVFAGYAALRLGRRRQAERRWLTALTIAGDYVPALRALRR